MRFMRIIAMGIFTFALAACSSSNSTGTLSCSATGTTLSTTEVSNPTVSILNGNGGPYTVTLPGAAAVQTDTTSYTYPGTLTVTTGSLVTVTDTSNNASASCTLYTGSTYGTSGTLTASNSYPAVGQSVTITGSAGLSYTFSLATPVAGVVLTPTSAYSATLTSTLATSVTVNGIDSSGLTSTITIVFGGSTGGGTTYGTITPSTTYGTVGSPITLTGNPSYTYTFQLISGPGYVSQTSAYSATVTATAAGTITILATSPTAGQTTITLTFSTTGTGTGGYATCQLTAQYIAPLTYTFTLDYGQSYLTSFYPGEGYNGAPPTFPRTSLTLRFDTAGIKTLNFTGQNVYGQPCSGTTSSFYVQ